jgi:hypothetical protein
VSASFKGDHSLTFYRHEDEVDAGANARADAGAETRAEDAKPKVINAEEGRADDPYTIGPDGWIVYDSGIPDHTRNLGREIIHRVLTTRLKNVICMFHYFH